MEAPRGEAPLSLSGVAFSSGRVSPLPSITIRSSSSSAARLRKKIFLPTVEKKLRTLQRNLNSDNRLDGRRGWTEESVCVSTERMVSRAIVDKPVYVAEIAPVGFFPRSLVSPFPYTSTHCPFFSLFFSRRLDFSFFANRQVAKRGHPVN